MSNLSATHLVRLHWDRVHRQSAPRALLQWLQYSSKSLRLKAMREMDVAMICNVGGQSP